MEAIEHLKKRVEEAVLFLEDRLEGIPEVILVLGTGLGGIASQMEKTFCFPYETIPHFPRSTVPGHAGNLLYGHLGGKRVAALQGRFHYYEGYSTQELTFPVRVLSLLGAKIAVVSNAAGGLNPAYAPGTLMIISDHLNFIPDNPLRGPNVDEWGPRFPDCSRVYDPDLIDKVLECARRLSMPKVVTGTYVAIPGPSLETPAETRFLRLCGADAVGMSTVPEAIAARHLGMRVLGISCVTNMAAGVTAEPLSHAEVVAVGKRVEAELKALVLGLVDRL